MTETTHFSVLLKESVDALLTNENGAYLDGTFGRGGHSKVILSRLGEQGSLLACDKDPEAVAVGNTLAQEDPRFSIVHGSFNDMRRYVQEQVPGLLDGILLDLGVSSPQLDQAERGFSFMRDGPLDMRMDNSEGQTAAQWIAQADEKDIAFVLKEYGEERFSKRIARAIVEKRQEMEITRTAQLAEIVSAANPKWEKGKNPATRSFQAIRIFINRELEDLVHTLSEAVDLVKPNGRIVVISFHSLEDRIVKRFFRDKSKGKKIPMSIPVTEDMLGKELTIIGKKIKASKDEVDENPRSRSAVMRVAAKI